MTIKADILASALSGLVKKHHEAFAVELLGQDAAGLTAEQVQDLVNGGIVNPAKLTGFVVPGTSLDPFLFTRMVSLVIDSFPPEERGQLRQWPLEKWVTAVNTMESFASTPGPLELGGLVTFGRPPAPEVGQTEEVTPADEPWMNDIDRDMHRLALDRTGRFIRGLGNTAAAQTENIVAETWDGEDLVSEVDEALRQDRLKIIREQTAEAVKHKDPRKLARDLAFETKDWARDWGRIARTEIQAGYNEARVIDASRNYGDEAMIARIPESEACDHCLRLFLDADGNPRLWSPEELAGNGTNVGRRRDAWMATLHPVHPYCRCDTVVVPPGLKVDAFGRMEKIDA